MWIQLQDINGERDENGKEEKDVTIPNGEENPNEAGEKAGKESKKNNGELIVDKNTQKILKSLSNGNGNKKPKKQNNFYIKYSSFYTRN